MITLFRWTLWQFIKRFQSDDAVSGAYRLLKHGATSDRVDPELRDACKTRLRWMVSELARRGIDPADL